MLPIIKPRQHIIIKSTGVITLMLLAYILINTEIGDEEKVYSDLKSTEGVVEVHIVYGVYDMVVKVEAKDMDNLRSIVENIRKKSGLRSTLTLIVTK